MKHMKHHPLKKDKDQNLSDIKKQDHTKTPGKKKLDADKHLADVKKQGYVGHKTPSNKKLSSETHLSNDANGKIKKVAESQEAPVNELKHIQHHPISAKDQNLSTDSKKQGYVKGKKPSNKSLSSDKHLAKSTKGVKKLNELMEEQGEVSHSEFMHLFEDFINTNGMWVDFVEFAKERGYSVEEIEHELEGEAIRSEEEEKRELNNLRSQVDRLNQPPHYTDPNYIPASRRSM
jgi:hypothetical protein